MSARKRIDVEECEDFVGFEELEGGDIAFVLLCQFVSCGFREESGCTFDDLAEDTSSGHFKMKCEVCF